ncbi:hypothetical protein F5B22DRAFT_608822 [Xylaria bambusicola]|uniref:uncharacterized protein n=1 Tax=Xylaria bambusicola TaxID=326684 RepID=UPI0020072000|nr:uncharacterized protein F5B22DRAFT_608822 [Xylaria bambusicola]KAI0514899.1 hypothetical protein F5B22DRAFT_608822 [Xylaria bambusicola]
MVTNYHCDRFDPHEAPPQPPAPGEPGGFAGPAGPNELGATGSLGGPGGIGGPMGPPFPPQYFGFIDAYKDPDPNTSAPTGPASGSASIPRRPASMGLPPWGPASMGLPPMGPPPMGPPSMGPPPMGPPGGGRRRGGGRGSGSSGGGSIRGRGGGPAPFTAPASFQPPANQGSTNNQGGGPGAHGNQALAAGPVHQTPLDSFSMDEDSYRGKALHQSRVHKTGYVRKGDNVFRVQRIGDFRDANAAAFVKRAIQQEANMREDYARAIQSWEDIDIDYPRDSFHDEDDDDPYEADPMEIDSPDERRRQIDGFKAELAIHMLDVYKAELVLGQGVLANFDPHLEPLSSNDRSPTIEESARMPEFSINRGRDKPVAESLRMNRLLGLEGADEIYDY